MKRVLVTGASAGIGRQLVQDYLLSGWEVIACGRSKTRLDEAFLPHERLFFAVFDTRDASACCEALADTGRLDLVILNAGTCEYIDDVRHFDTELFARVMQTNVQGTVNCLAPVLRHMGPGSRLAIISSSVTFLPLTRAEAYGASKAALDYLARALAVDLVPDGIGVSLVRPGFVDTPLTRRNDFPMPGLIDVDRASQAIRRGLDRGRAEITFPFVFISVMRMLSWLPGGLWQRIAARMIGREA